MFRTCLRSIQKIKQGTRSGLQHKLPDLKMENFVKNDLVMTIDGLKSREEVSSNNLRIIPNP